MHDPNRARGNGRTAFVPEGGLTDAAQLQAKWGAKAKALFAAQPKKVGSAPQVAPSAAPARPTAAPQRPQSVAADDPKPWASFPQTSDGAFAFYCSLLGEPYKSEKHDEKWFDIYDKTANGKDPDQLSPADVQALFKAVSESVMPF